MLVSLMVDEFLSERAVRLSALSRKDYAGKLGPLVGWLTEQGVTDSASLSLPVLVKYMTWLREVPTARERRVRAGKTLLTHYKVLVCLLRWSVDAEYLTPRVLKLPAPKVEQRLPRTIAPQDRGALVKAAGGGHGGAMQARDTAIALLLLDTGLRASELCGLSVDDVKEQEGFVLVRNGKGSKWRTVGPLSDRTVRALKAYRNTWRPRQQPTCDAFFLSRKHGPLGRKALGEITGRLKDRAGVSVGNPHAFRHQYAHALARNGASVLAISKLLGHSSLSVTSHYLQSFSSEDARRMVGSVVDSL